MDIFCCYKHGCCEICPSLVKAHSVKITAATVLSANLSPIHCELVVTWALIALLFTISLEGYLIYFVFHLVLYVEQLNINQSYFYKFLWVNSQSNATVLIFKFFN